LSDQHGDSTERVFLIAFAGTSAKTAESNRTTIGQGMRKPEEDLRSVMKPSPSRSAARWQAQWYPGAHFFWSRISPALMRATTIMIKRGR